LDFWQAEPGSSLGRQVAQLHFFAALQVHHLLVCWSGLVVALIEVRWEEREDVIDPILIIGPSELWSRLPSTTDGSKRHRFVMSVWVGNGAVLLLSIGQWLALDRFPIEIVMEALASWILQVRSVPAWIGVRFVYSAESVVVGNRQTGERFCAGCGD